MAQAVQTNEHDENQDAVSSKYGNGTESDAVQLEHTAPVYII